MDKLSKTNIAETENTDLVSNETETSKNLSDSTKEEVKIYEKKVYKAGVVDVSALMEAQIRDVADARMTESKEDRSKNWITRTAKRFWKHNVAQDWYRQREIERVRKEIHESGNLYAGETKDTNLNDYNEAKAAVVERFISEYEEEMLKKEEKDSKKYVTDEKAKESIKSLIKQFAADTSMSEAAFTEEQNRILAASNPEYSEKGKMYATNLLDIAREVRNSAAHGEKLSEMDFDVEITLGQAKETLNTQAKHNSFEKIIEKTQSSKLGRYLFNEPAGVAIAAGLYSAANFLGVKVLRSKLAKWGTFGATALLAGGISAAKKASRLNRERAQHIRESAKGMEFKESDMKRRKEMEENRYETKNASEILKNLELDLAKVSNGEINEEELNVILANLSDLESRVKLGEKEKVDLIAYSRFNEMEKEKMNLNLYRARIKVALRNGIKDGRIEFNKDGSFDDYLKQLTDVQAEALTTDIEQKNNIFNKMKIKKVAWEFTKTALIGASVGAAFQEARAFFQPGTNGFIEGLVKHFKGGEQNVTSKVTALEEFRRWVAGESDKLPFGKGHEFMLGKTHMQLPDGISINPNADGTYDILSEGKVISDNIKLGLLPNGDFTDASKEILAQNNIYSTFSLTGAKVTEHVTTEAKEYINKHPGLTTKISREWLGNNTKMYPDPEHPGHLLGADLNELRTQFGGVGGTGIDANGNYVMSVQHMTNDGSFQDGLPPVAAHDEMKKGGLTLLLSVTKGLQHMVFKVPVDADGNAIINPKSESGQMMFQNKDGHAIFTGQFAEIGHPNGIATDGTEHMQILGTHIGTGRPGNIIEDIVRDTTAPNIQLNQLIDYDVPPFIPVGARRPLERGSYKEVPPVLTYYINYNGQNTSVEQEKQFEKVRSITLKENPNAKLDHYKEIEMYLSNLNEKDLERIKRLSTQTEPMEKECKISVNIPIAGHQEAGNIYEALKSYANQTAKPEDFELVLFVNHPETNGKGKVLDATDTLNEIERFKKDFPDVRARVIYEVLSDKEANIGRIRKLMSDTTLLRHHVRGKDAPDLIMVSNDADNKGIDPRYLEAFTEKFGENPKVDGYLGQLDWDPESYQKFPDLHVGTRLFQYLNVVGRHNTNNMTSSGANSAYRSSIYAGIGGYIEDIEGGEDTAIRKAIIAARGDNERFAFAGTETRLYTSSRRAIVMLKQFGIAPLDQWRKGFSVQGDEEIRKLIMEDGPKIDYDNKETLEKLKKDLEDVINKTLDNYEEGEHLGKDNHYYKRALGWLGVKYKLDKNRNVTITKMTTLVEGLKRYQIEGKLMRDARSGDKEAATILQSIRGEKKGKIKNKENEPTKEITSEFLDAQIEGFMDKFSSNKEKIDAVNKLIGNSLNNETLKEIGLDIAVKEIQNKLAKLKNIDDKSEFLKKVIETLHPLGIALNENQKEFSDFQRKAFVEIHNFTPVNEAFSYRIDGGDLHIHLAPASDMGTGKKLTLIKDALDKLAQIVSSNKRVKEISATSWIVASSPRLLEKFGFKVEEISEETKKIDFPGETHDIKKAVIGREEFLKIYNKNSPGMLKSLLSMFSRKNK